MDARPTIARMRAPLCPAAGETVATVRRVSVSRTTLYVREDGDDDADGLTPATALRQIATAAARWRAAGPVYDTGWTIDVGPGTYTGGISLTGARGVAQHDFLRIVGPRVGGHPNRPLAVVDHDAHPGHRFGLRAYDGVSVWLQDLAFRGGFAHAVDVRRRSLLHWHNCHVDGQGVGQVGLGVLDHCTYAVAGGIVENLTKHGVQEHHHVFRSYDIARSYDEQLVIRHCPIGLKAKENCNGHVDYLTIEDCGTGMQLNGMSVANLRFLRLRRNGVGLAVVNSQVHNTGTVDFGDGDDANERDLVELGVSADLTSWGWQEGSFARTTTNAHRPLLTLAASYDDEHVDSRHPHAHLDFRDVLRGRRYRAAGTRFRVLVRGVVTQRLARPATLDVRLGTDCVAHLVVPARTHAGTAFEADVEVVCARDGDHQKVTARLHGVPGPLVHRELALDLLRDRTVLVVAAVDPDREGALVVSTVEVWG